MSFCLAREAAPVRVAYDSIVYRPLLRSPQQELCRTLLGAIPRGWRYNGFCLTYPPLQLLRLVDRTDEFVRWQQEFLRP